ncbi:MULTISPECIES: DAHL domain-containing protein [unclassified Pseudomonas]|uniref:DAHL domain-containing protein n=1 Tax=unclassified Pseudomonas TaxID=196821 RepID=UPI002AC9A1B2|nr:MULTISPECIES: DAHL domain-containing protein [unclassified Pseudomonas]MEB0040013.1 ATP-binding protein [Pseudomonas sp. MH10]MEB0076411.1 ATP-binding protein [Pseudomonas sp. MH10out]MEB0091240.1 ATP-binding protein [Pseudomonas sp. CCI4.2]MEB0100806.1 ATP-binding protein [Pseudomonas sp. CCI3.2]MEB0119538.1 ATP-binding protein [Pseudomonas sp. CCI1.2]
MKLSRRLISLLLGGLTLMLASTLLFLYIKSSTDNTTNYIESRDLISQIKQLNAQWETAILKARITANQNYDELVEPLTAINQLWEQFVPLELGRTRHTVIDWRNAGEAYLDAITEKTRLVEQFKSHNAILHNSLAFLPLAQDDIQFQFQQLDRSTPLLQPTLIDMYDLLLDCLEFSQVISDEKAADIQVGLNQLEVDKERLPPKLHLPLEILLSHVRLILREQPMVNDLVERIGAVPVAARLDDINVLLNGYQEQAAGVARMYHLCLLVLSALMFVLMLYLGFRLLRSYAEINRRINSALHAANENLEQRVEERTRELKDTQSELFDTARQAGMAEIATNVLHNVGNVLNSVNISAELVSRTVAGSKVIGLGKAVQLINEHADDLGEFISRDPKGKLLPNYLNQLDKALLAEQQSITEELARLTRSVDHIKDIVSTQQSYAGITSLAESLNINDLLEDALRMNSGALTRHRVKVIKDFSNVPDILADKHRLLLILINLISNAKYAMCNMDERARNMTVGVKFIDNTVLRISIRDEGEGILPENMTRIFAHGFTTRKEGHGFGLHSCALAAIEMKGRLSAHSDGPGKGATFVLELPLNIASDES